MVVEDTVFSATPECVACEFGEGVALLDTVSNQYFSLNAVGHFIWQQLDEPRSIAQITDRIIAHYGIDRARADQDVRKLMGQLAEHRLVLSQ